MYFIDEIGHLAFATKLKQLSDYIFNELDLIYKEFDFTFQSRWFGIIYLLSEKDKLNLTEISVQLKMSHSAVSQFISKLKKLDLIEAISDPNDDRRKLVSLTPFAKSEVERLKPYLKEIKKTTQKYIVDSGNDIFKSIDSLEKLFLENDYHSSILKRKIRVRLARVPIVF